MSNETTDARALPNELDFEQWYVENAFDYERDPLGSDKCGLQRKAWHAAIARLRGEAAQGEAGNYPDHDCANPEAPCSHPSHEEWLAQMASEDASPAPVAGDAVAKLANEWESRARCLSDSENVGGVRGGVMRQMARELTAALAQDRASQGAAAGVPDRAPLSGSEPRNLAFYLQWALDVMAEDPGLESYSMLVQQMHREAGYALAAAPSAPTQGAPAAPPTGPILTGTMTGGAAETDASVQARSDA